MECKHSTTGISDECFIRGDVPMTKAEIRILTLSKLKLREGMNFLDIGCGTGSITVEAALICKGGSVDAIDINEEAVKLTGKNVKAFGLYNVNIIQGSAPEFLPSKYYDRIFIGGSRNKISNLLKYCKEHLNPNGIVVINAILIDTVYEALRGMESFEFKGIECICTNISKSQKTNSGWMMKALNPVYIISGVNSNSRKEND